ncbi:biotin-dependent carboxyltransferase family protein [Pedobacter sp. Hv1]|uniref:5-oxoprolinase subunit C family protein n=1 Tax=Pedobacter sp. Hv1 TaxID=1740090 RepID=UPI0006D8C4C6|nr:biotin-dependent carboxyltransferase family protein [Pedobacter sp. Hv1]KQB98600.1 urea amidolyase [Pedobacter sp. Hv1]
MQISIIKPGLLTTIQDLGRFAYRSQAVPVSGAMDKLAASLANTAVGNIANATVIEFTYADASFTVEQDILIAYSGLGAILSINDVVLQADRPLFIPAGKKVSLINNPKGARTYLAVAGGWQVPTILGSSSTYLIAKFGGYEGRSLQMGDLLQHNPKLSDLNLKILASLKGDDIKFPNWGINNCWYPTGTKEIRVVPAQEFNWFDGRSITDFLTKPYTLSTQCNRMGYNLNGPAFTRAKKGELLSTAVTFGTIQVTGNGSLILLMADGQTTGGYPRIAQVAAVDLPLCAQMKPNDQLFFKEISAIAAQTLYIERELELKQLSTAIGLKF